MDDRSSLIIQHFGIGRECHKIAAVQLLVAQFLGSSGGILSADSIPSKCDPLYSSSSTRASAPPMLTATNNAPLLLDGVAFAHCAVPVSSCSSSPSTSASPSASSDRECSSSSVVVPIRCRWSHCSRLFASSEPFLEHVRLDHLVHLHLRNGQRKFACLWTDCERGARPFSAIYMLVQHLRAHTGEKPYKCEWPNCEKCYSRLENLKTHQRKHTGERPYQCTVCERSFTNASDKAKHVNRVHKEKKQYQCAVMGCASAYTDPSSLRKHTLASHGADPWKEYKAKRRTVRRTETERGAKA